MCGIVAYKGHKNCYPILLDGLHKLEYRGYDSAGVALLNGKINVYKKQGKVADLLAFSEDKDTASSIGIGHTRWATHGVPNDVNAHPHTSQSKSIALIHNGIIENYASLKEELIHRGFSFSSDTIPAQFPPFSSDWIKRLLATISNFLTSSPCVFFFPYISPIVLFKVALFNSFATCLPANFISFT